MNARKYICKTVYGNVGSSYISQAQANERAQQLDDGKNTGCRYCVDCTNCFNCIGCHECVNCTDCVYCVGATGLSMGKFSIQ